MVNLYAWCSPVNKIICHKSNKLLNFFCRVLCATACRLGNKEAGPEVVSELRQLSGNRLHKSQGAIERLKDGETRLLRSLSELLVFNFMDRPIETKKYWIGSVMNLMKLSIVTNSFNF